MNTWKLTIGSQKGRLFINLYYEKEELDSGMVKQ